MTEIDILLQLDEPIGNKSKRVQLAKTGAFNHSVYGKFSILLTDLEKMRSGLENDIRRQKIDNKPVLPFDYKHDEADVAAGWIERLYIDKDENGIDSLFGEVEWTPIAAQKIRDKEFKFVSPSIQRNYKDAETGKKYDIVLKGATLTNIPFLRDMEAIHLLSEADQKLFMPLYKSGNGPGKPIIGGDTMSKEKIVELMKPMSPDNKKKVLTELSTEMGIDLCNDNKKTKKLAEDLEEARAKLKLSEEKIKVFEKKAEGSDDLEERLMLSESKNTDLNKKLETLITDIATEKKGREFDQMLAEGKVCEAQRKPFVEGNIIEFAANAEAINLYEKGSGSGIDEIGDAQDKILKLAEKKQSENEGIDLSEAISEVLAENKNLAAAYNKN